MVVGTEMADKNCDSWKSFTQSKISDKGMSLNIVASMIVNGASLAKLAKNDVDRMTEQWANALVVYIIGQNPSMMAITNYCKAQWAPKTEPRIFKHEEGYFIIKMENREDIDAILYAGPHLFYGRAMIMKQWTSDFSFHQEILKVVSCVG